MIIPTSVLAIVIATPTTVHADVRLSGHTRYILEKTHTPTGAGRVLIRSVYRDRRGATALVMEADVEAGRPVEVRADNRQDGLRARVQLQPGKVAFDRATANGDEQHSTTEALGVVLVGPEVNDYIQSEEAWRRLARGETVHIQIAAWRKMDTYGFELTQVASAQQDTIVVRMRPSSWVVRAFVDEMHYTFDRSTRRILRYHGPVSIECEDAQGKLNPPVGDVVYSYQ